MADNFYEKAIALMTTLTGGLRVGGDLFTTDYQIQRPTNTTPYTVNSVVTSSTANPTSIEFLNPARVAGGRGYIVKALCYTNQPTMTGQLRLHLHRGIPIAGGQPDGSPFFFGLDNADSYEGYIDFSTFITGTGFDNILAWSVGSLATITGLPFRVETNPNKLYGIIQNLNAWTPATGQIFRFYLTFDRY